MNKKVYQKQWYLKNKERVKEKSKNYYKNNQDKIKEWYKKNKIRILKRKKQYSQSLGGIYHLLKGNAKQRNIPFNLIKNDFKKWYKTQNKICIICKKPENEIRKSITMINKKVNRLTIDRVDNTKGYQLDNLCLLCFNCNAFKSNLTKKDIFKVENLLKLLKGVKNENK